MNETAPSCSLLDCGFIPPPPTRFGWLPVFDFGWYNTWPGEYAYSGNVEMLLISGRVEEREPRLSVIVFNFGFWISVQTRNNRNMKQKRDVHRRVMMARILARDDREPSPLDRVNAACNADIEGGA